MIDAELRYRRINRVLADFNGVPVEQTLGKTVAEVLPAAYPAIAPMLHEVLVKGVALENFRVLAEVPSAPGELSDWEASYLPVREADGSVIGILVTAVNITLQNRAEQALKDGDARLRRVLDSLFAFVGVLTPDGVLLEANRAPLQAAGIGLEDVQGRHFWDTFWWSYDPALQEWLRDSVRTAALGGVVRSDVVVRMAGDSRMTIDFMLAPMRDQSREVTHVIASAIDVSDRVASERALRASEARFRGVFEAAPDGMTLIDRDGRILLANRSMGELFGCDPQGLIGTGVDSLFPRQPGPGAVTWSEAFPSASGIGARGSRWQGAAVRADGSSLPVEVGLNPIVDSDPPERLVTMTSISERLSAQAELERALAEKTALLNEVHHRVKNNLQIIASLLRLQSRHAEPSVGAVLNDSHSRVRAMALTHQLLYERGDYAGLELGPYVRGLVALLRDSYVQPGSPIELQALVPESGLRIDLDQAVSCGLVVNELVTNALKHAFPDGRAGRITVRAWAEGETRVRVEVADDGVGPPGPFDELAEGGPLGFQLIRILCGQLRADLDVSGPPGMRIIMSLPRSGAQA